eukprot:4394719-Alexandrium_andersonii.AAC.1
MSAVAYIPIGRPLCQPPPTSEQFPTSPSLLSVPCVVCVVPGAGTRKWHWVGRASVCAVLSCWGVGWATS